MVTNLEIKIETIKSKLSEFIDKQSLDNLIKNSYNKAMWSFHFMKLVDNQKALIERVVLLYDATVVYHGCMHDNFRRSEKDNLIVYEFNDDNKIHEIPFRFPKGNEFNKDTFKSNLYCVTEQTVRECKEQAKTCLPQYQIALLFWLAELKGDAA